MTLVSQEKQATIQFLPLAIVLTSCTASFIRRGSPYTDRDPGRVLPPFLFCCLRHGSGAVLVARRLPCWKTCAWT